MYTTTKSRRRWCGSGPSRDRPGTIRDILIENLQWCKPDERPLPYARYCTSVPSVCKRGTGLTRPTTCKSSVRNPNTRTRVHTVPSRKAARSEPPDPRAGKSFSPRMPHVSLPGITSIRPLTSAMSSGAILAKADNLPTARQLHRFAHLARRQARKSSTRMAKRRSVYVRPIHPTWPSPPLAKRSLAAKRGVSGRLVVPNSSPRLHSRSVIPP